MPSRPVASPRRSSRAFPELAAIAVADLHARQVDWCREQAESYQAYRRANGEPEFTTSGAWPVRRAALATARDARRSGARRRAPPIRHPTDMLF